MALWAFCAFSSLAFYGIVAYVIGSAVTALLGGSGALDGFDGCCPCPAYKKTAADSEEKEAAHKTNNEQATMERPASSYGAPAEDKEAYTVTLCTPGVASADLEVKLQMDGSTQVLTVNGEACSQQVGPRCVQRTYRREYKLLKPVIVDKVTAVYADGILTVTLPKQRVPVHHIKIERATPAPAAAPQRSTTAAAAVPVTAASPTVKGEKADAVTPAPNEWEVVQERAENIDCAILAELNEMGFTDRALNAELLAKHGGALNAVVKELVARARTPVTKTGLASAIDEAAG